MRGKAGVKQFFQEGALVTFLSSVPINATAAVEGNYDVESLDRSERAGCDRL